MINFGILTKLYYACMPMRFVRYHAYRVKKFIELCASNYDRNGVLVLDIGAGSAGWSDLFSKAKYLAQDIQQNPVGSINYVCDLCSPEESIPDALADVIICTQVLEHIPEPTIAFEQLNRMLKPRGEIYLTTHMAFEEHMLPHDYWRFTENGIKHIALKSGFEVLSFKHHGSTAQLIHYLFWSWPIRLFWPERSGLLYIVYCALSTPFIIFSGALAIIMDGFDKKPSIYPNFEIIMKKTK